MHRALELIKSQSKPIGLNSSYGDSHMKAMRKGKEKREREELGV